MYKDYLDILAIVMRWLKHEAAGRVLWRYTYFPPTHALFSVRFFLINCHPKFNAYRDVLSKYYPPDAVRYRTNAIPQLHFKYVATHCK